MTLVEGEFKRTEGRGRNGWMYAKRFSVLAVRRSLAWEGFAVWVSVWSSRTGRYAPIQLKMSEEDALRLADSLTRGVAEHRAARAVQHKQTAVGEHVAALLSAVTALGVQAAAEPAHCRPTVRTPRDVADLLAPEMARLEQEHFRCVLLNTKHKVVSVAPVAVGSLDSAAVHPRDVFREAIRRNAAAVILVHNHPSGDPEPSSDDVQVTGRLVDAGNLVAIRVLDHVIIGDGRFVSLQERGLLTPQGRSA